MRDRLEGKQYVEQYVHALTHELKSPLAAIRGSAELVESGGEAMPAADRARFLATIRAQGDRMAEMVDKLLALAAVEHRQRIEEPQPVDLVALARRGRGTPGAEAHATSACSAHRRARRRSCRAMPFLLRQALINLIDNAADFAPRGQHGGAAIARDGRTWQVTVADRGPGVPDYALAARVRAFLLAAAAGGGSRSSGLGLSFVAEVGRAARRRRDARQSRRRRRRRDAVAAGLTSHSLHTGRHRRTARRADTASDTPREAVCGWHSRF